MCLRILLGVTTLGLLCPNTDGSDRLRHYVLTADFSHEDDTGPTPKILNGLNVERLNTSGSFLRQTTAWDRGNRGPVWVIEGGDYFKCFFAVPEGAVNVELRLGQWGFIEPRDRAEEVRILLGERELGRKVPPAPGQWREDFFSVAPSLLVTTPLSPKPMDAEPGESNALMISANRGKLALQTVSISYDLPYPTVQWILADGSTATLTMLSPLPEQRLPKGIGAIPISWKAEGLSPETRIKIKYEDT